MYVSLFLSKATVTAPSESKLVRYWPVAMQNFDSYYILYSKLLYVFNSVPHLFIYIVYWMYTLNK